VKQKLTVIVDADGEVVGTQVQDYPLPEGVASARLVAGPGQKRHEIEVEVPARFATPKDIDQFHAHVKSQLPSK
jgi:hypothetical protein